MLDGLHYSGIQGETLSKDENSLIIFLSSYNRKLLAISIDYSPIDRVNLTWERQLNSTERKAEQYVPYLTSDCNGTAIINLLSHPNVSVPDAPKDA